ncbi:N-6 DNA methylase [Actinomadura monticuli]|uniref:N-6 DNA methylase n=1 Tax=Actinomadura monticuli TaxID=3097367 RepID=A0ABV4Q875_9ACTN
MADIARRTGVQRPAVTNWRRRHADFPAPAERSPQELFDAAEVARWLDTRRVSAKALRPDEPPGSTFGERFRRTYEAGSPDAAASASMSRVRGVPVEARASHPPPHLDPDEEQARRLSSLLMGRSRALSGVGDPAAYTDVVLILLYLRSADPQGWSWLASESRGGRDFIDVLRETVHRHVGERPTRKWLSQPAMRVADGLPPAAHWDPIPLIDLVDSLAAAHSAPSATLVARLIIRLLDETVRQEGHRGGEFRTPQSVTELVAGLAAADPDDRVLDPCCGSGDLLLSVAAPVKTSTSAPVTGRALSPRPALWAGINLTLHGVPALLSSDALDDLRRPAEPDESYDLIVSNPPFAMHWADRVVPGDHRWVYGTPPGNNANFAWLQHIAARLAPGGRAVTVIPPNATFSTRKADSTIRAGMIEDGLVACVILLPGGLFASTGIPVTIWVLEKGRSRRDVLMINAGGAAESDFPEIIRIYREWRRGRGEGTRSIPARAVGLAELRAAGHSLSPGQFLSSGRSGIDRREAAEILRLSAALIARLAASARRIDDEVTTLAGALAGQGPGEGGHGDGWLRTPLGRLCTVQPGPPRTRLPGGDPAVPVVTARQIRNRRIHDEGIEHTTAEFAASVPQCRLMPGDLVSVRTGTIDRVALADDRHTGWLIGSGCVLLRPRGEILPSYLLHYLSHPQVVEWVRRSATSAVLPTISIRRIRELPVLLPPIERQREIVGFLNALDESIVAHDAILGAAHEMHTAALGALLGDVESQAGPAAPA